MENQFNNKELEQLEEILRTKPNIKIPEFNEEIYFNKEIEPIYIIRKKYTINQIVQIAAIILFIFTISFLYFQQNLKIDNINELKFTSKYDLEKTKKTNPIIGIILISKGKVEIYSEDIKKDPVIGYTGTTIVENTTIKTYDNSLVEILLEKRVQIRMKENTQITFHKKENTWNILQHKGESYHNVIKLNPTEEYYVETLTTIAGVRGTFFRVKSDTNISEIEVHKGKVEIFTKDLSTHQITNKGILTTNHQFFYDKKNSKIEKKDAKNLEFDVIYNEMQKNLELIHNNKEIWEEVKKIPTTMNKKEIEKVYNRRIEKIYLHNGRILEGVIASQINNYVILHTTEGILVLKISDIKEITYIEQ
jgi:hypothetical protein